ncbi:MAG: hypothetical protein JSU68_06740 [Phycisphaerales bacterium]|nr:MAG: hypothetical protein JSU68_06740 [Phycisphaerales bacterium]
MVSTKASVTILAWLVGLGMVFASGAMAGGPRPVLEDKRPADAVKRSKSDEPTAGRQAARPKGKGPQAKPRAKADRPKKPSGAPAGVEETLVIVLRHTAADRVADHVARLFRGSIPVRVSADEPTNILLVRADAGTLDQVRQMVKRLESAAAQSAQHIGRNVRVYRLQYADAQRVGAMIQELAPFSGQAKPPTIEWDVRTNAVLVNAADTDWNAIETIIRAVDVRD